MTEVKIAKIISNGCGIGWADGKTFFVPYTLSGETVRIKSAVKEKSFFYAEDFELLEASPERRKPLCRYYGICGGCSLQHASYPEQLRIKKLIFSELFKQNQITLDIDPIVITPGETGLRTRAKLFSFKGKPAYRKKRSSDFAQIENCPLLDPVFFEKILADIPKRRGDTQFEYSKFTGDFLPGAETLRKSVLGKIIKIRRDSFFQSSEEGAGIMCSLVMREAEEIKANNAADLFCGSGLFSLFLADKGIKTTGFEIEEAACISYAENLGNKAEIVKMNAYNLNHLEKTDLVIADPPRAGLGPKLSEVICKNTDNVVYIACEPPNLVRDLKIFFTQGFHVKHLYIIDLFPDTPHFETVCIMSKLS
ncbi:class I SAM-dependent RNA methyltransferase [bacterium]|nr:class I SAM-dependent RNA methyltransferase [bacterium]